jgi:hypothetical protein
LVLVCGIIAIILYLWINAILENPELHWRWIRASLWGTIIPVVAWVLLYHFARRRIMKSKYRKHWNFWDIGKPDA